MRDKKMAVVTGASAGIGAATAIALGRAGFDTLIGARRQDKLRQVAATAGGSFHPLDVTDAASVEAFVAQVDHLEVLVNNAGGALGLDLVQEASEDRWQRMWELNFMSTVRMTKALLPLLVASGDGLIINVGSTAGFETYPGGGGYTGVKHAMRALTRTLRRELLGQPVRVSEVSPGLVATEFSMVRFDQNKERADSVYAGMTPLTASDIAEAIAWVATRPSHVNIDEMVIRPRDQATSTRIFRGGQD
jgi:NADP-dependent 3-hydroxy acid dehydrogenase YdfG